MCLDLKRAFSVVAGFECLIGLTLLGFSIFLFVQDVQISNYWPIIGVAIGGLVNLF
jgi:hypothetical protein